MGSLIWLQILFHVFVAILIKAPLHTNKVVVVSAGIFRRPLVVIVMRTGGKYKPAIKDGR